MMKSWCIDRRTLLRGTGVALALPWLEAMSAAAADNAASPKRFCALYFPFGVSMSTSWKWFPGGSGKNYRFGESLKCLEPVREQITILGGLSHPQARGAGGHATADTFLTGAKMRTDQRNNTVSLDQVVAAELGEGTRFPSLVFSSDGGTGVPALSSTLSYAQSGQPIPALNRPAFIFERLFGLNADAIETQRRRLNLTGSHLDLLLEDARSLERKLGRGDQRKLDEYLASVREVEQSVERTAQWLDRPKPTVNATGLTLDANSESPREWIRTMLDLLVLALQTDSSRVATYQIGSMGGVANGFPKLIGLGAGYHNIAHKVHEAGGYKRLGKFDEFLAENLLYFLQRLAAIEEKDGTLLDNTIVLYGSSNSKTHVNRDYPLILAGGKSMNYQHGEFRRFGENVPLSNLFLTMLHRLGIEAESFADSSGEIDL